MTKLRPRYRFLVFAFGLGVMGSGCSGSDAPSQTFYEREIQPILINSCAGSVSPCHKDNGAGIAQGNLDVTTFENVQKRRDLLDRYGAYPEALLLIKAVASAELTVAYGDEFLPLEIPHAGGAILRPGTDAYLKLKIWLDNGATQNGLPPIPKENPGEGACTTDIASGLEQFAANSSEPGFDSFGDVQKFLVKSCGAGTCHGSPRAGYRLTCGTTDEQVQSNYLMTRAFVADTVDDSPILVKVLDPAKGGSFHAGGVFFHDRTDEQYVATKKWAEEAGVLQATNQSQARTFFEEEVMPVFLKRGCTATACHSPVVPFKVNLRGGAQGFFPVVDLNINYKAAKKFLALDSPNPIASRLIAKNILAKKGGIAHRAGSLLETPGHPDEPYSCPDTYDPETASPLCTIEQWRRLERAELPQNAISTFSEGTTTPLVYVSRPADAPRFIDFHLHRPGADLVRADATMGSHASISTVTGETSLLDSCPNVGAGRDNIDVRRPVASYDGTRVAFAMRIGESDGLNLYEVAIDGTGCRAITTDGGTMVNGIKIEHFDPLYVTDKDGAEWLVYASTRGKDGPTRTPKHFLPNADLWRQLVTSGTPEQLTFLRGTVTTTWLTVAGKVNMVVEKLSPEYYQVGSRRLNWDRSDYHPQIGQRKESYQGRGGYLAEEDPPEGVPIVQSIGYAQVSQVRQGSNADFLLILADEDSYGGGALGVFNRSLGPFEAGRDEPGYLKSLTIMPGATGHPGEKGAYRSPYPLPDSTILVSYAQNADVGTATPQAYDLVIVNPTTKERRVVVSGQGASIVDAILVAPRYQPSLFSLGQETDATPTKDLAVLNYNDLPLLATLQGANDRRGRRIESLRGATQVRYFTHEAPPASCTSPSHPDCSDKLVGTQKVYESRVDLGSARLLEDGSAFIRVPANLPVFYELLDDNKKILYRTQEATQFGPFENINLAVPENAYPTLCAVCHGSISGKDIDITVDVDVVSTASQTLAKKAGVVDLAK